SARRAARRARPEDAPAHAGRAEEAAARGRHHLRLRHPRPGGGASAFRRDRGHAGRGDRPAGNPEEIYRRPVSSYVADFIGETNLLRGEAAGGGIVAVRPEHVRIEAPDAVATPSVTGTVSDARFMGPVHRVFVTVADGQELRADITGQ